LSFFRVPKNLGEGSASFAALAVLGRGPTFSVSCCFLFLSSAPRCLPAGLDAGLLASMPACWPRCWPAGLDACLLVSMLACWLRCWPAGLDACLWPAGLDGLEFCQSVFSDRFFHFLQRFFFFVG
ncbi:hypothetical protein, partial [Thiolapillus sp.]|uniref:hypothetical protein n=1 Tax=Thiolapillus sp. TaxID=2017437 RepID=UPI003AF5B711